MASAAQLSRHSSLEEEELDLNEDRNRKKNKDGQHPPANKNLGFAGAAYTVGAAAKQRRGRRKKGYDLATALKIAGGVAIAGASWCPKVFSGVKDPKDELYTTALAATVVAKGRRFRRKKDQGKTVAAALETAAGVAIAAAAWTPATKPQVQQNLSFEGAVATATVINKANRIRHTEGYSIAHGLRLAGGVAIAAGSWEPQKRSMKGTGLAARAIAKASKRYKRIKEYSVAEALRTAGGVAVVGASWTGLLPHEPIKETTPSPARNVESIKLNSRQIDHPILVDMGTSPIPQYQADTPIVSTEPIPIPIELTPEIAPLVGASSQSITPTDIYSTPSIPSKSPMTPAVVVQSTRSPTPVIVVQPVKSPTPIVEPVKTPTPPLVIESLSATPQPSPKQPTPVPQIQPDPVQNHVTPVTNTVVHTIVKDEERPRSVRSRHSINPAALLVAAHALDQRHEPSVNVKSQKLPSPTPPPVQKEEATPVQLNPPTPAEASANDIEEIVIPEEEAVTVAGAAAAPLAAPKPKRKPLAQLTPLERLTAKARSLQ